MLKRKSIQIYILFADKKEQIPQPRTFAQKALFVHTFQNKICDGQKVYLTTPKSESNSRLGHGTGTGHSDSWNMSSKNLPSASFYEFDLGHIKVGLSDLFFSTSPDRFKNHLDNHLLNRIFVMMKTTF